MISASKYPLGRGNVWNLLNNCFHGSLL